MIDSNMTHPMHSAASSTVVTPLTTASEIRVRCPECESEINHCGHCGEDLRHDAVGNIDPRGFVPMALVPLLGEIAGWYEHWRGGTAGGSAERHAADEMRRCAQKIHEWMETHMDGEILDTDETCDRGCQ